MAVIRLTDEQSKCMYTYRPNLENDTFTLVRVRCAIMCTRQMYKQWRDRTNGVSFELWAHVVLDSMRLKGKPHPLQWEMLLCLKAYSKQEMGHHVYSGIARHRAHRAIHKVRYGGRR